METDPMEVENNQAHNVNDNGNFLPIRIFLLCHLAGMLFNIFYFSFSQPRNCCCPTASI